jgi:hypothetical protein
VGGPGQPRRPFAARVDPGRDLDDVNFNRLWEYATS